MMASFVGSNAVVKDGSSAVDSKELDSNDESLFGLDPLFWTHVPLFVRDVLSLRRCGRAQVFAWSPGCLSVNDPMNGPVNDSRFLRLCQVSGIVVGREDLTKCMRFLLDDGSGTVQCTLFNNETASLQSIQSISLGSLVTVKGKIQEFRETRGLVVHSLCLEDSMPNAEWVRWLEIVKARKRVLNTPPPLLPPHLAAEKEALLRPGPVLLSRNAPKEHQPQPFEHQIGLAMEGFLTEQDFLGLALSWASFNSNTENNTFTYTKMVSDPRLLQAAHRVFETQHGTPNPSQPRLHSLFKRTLRGLVVGGHIYLSCPNTDAYAVILDETLDKELLHWFSTANRDASTQGKSSELAILALRQDWRWESVPRSQWAQSLARLVEDGRIFESGTGEYTAM